LRFFGVLAPVPAREFVRGLPKRGKLKGGRLVVGAGAGVAVFHGRTLQPTYATGKPLIRLGWRRVAKLTLCETRQKAQGGDGASFCLMSGGRS